MNSPAIRFAGFTDSWEERKLGEIADIVRGASPRPIKDPKWFDDESDIGWLRISDVTEQNGRIQHLEQHLSELGQEKTRILTEPHLLLSIAATVGKPVINYISTGVHDGFLIFQNPLFNREFMFQWLEMFRPKWQQYGQPGSQVNLNSDLVKNNRITLPGELEQKNVGKLFSDLDVVLDLHQREYDKTVNIKKALLEKMFPKDGENKPKMRFAGFTDAWESRKIGDLCCEFRSGEFIKASDISPSGDYPVYGGNGLRGYASFYNHDGDFALIGRQGALCGNMQFSCGKAYFTEHAVAVMANNSNDTLFLYYLLETMNLGQYSGQSAQPGLAVGKLNALESRVPVKAEQEKISEFFTNLDRLITLHKRELTKLQNIKKALLEKMFV